MPARTQESPVCGDERANGTHALASTTRWLCTFRPCDQQAAGCLGMLAAVVRPLECSATWCTVPGLPRCAKVAAATLAPNRPAMAALPPAAVPALEALLSLPRWP